MRGWSGLIQLTQLKQKVALVEVVGAVEAKQPSCGSTHIGVAEDESAITTKVILPAIFPGVIQTRQLAGIRIETGEIRTLDRIAP